MNRRDIDIGTASVLGAPDGMVSVTQEQFYALVGPRNVASVPYRYHTEWVDQDAWNRLIGWASAGYASPYGARKEYFLVPDFAGVQGGAA